MNVSNGVNTAAKVVRLSGLQKEVVSLYRKFIRVSIQKDKKNLQEQSNNHQTTTTTSSSLPPTQQSSLTQYIRNQFRQKAKSISRREISKIEVLVLRGKRQLKLLGTQEASGFAVFSSPITSATTTTEENNKDREN
eukprot:gene658-813_t